jgi:hypothetical protein
MVEVVGELPVGAEIRLDSSFGFLIDAKVIWTKGGQTGMQFREPFNLKLLQAAKPGRV